MRVYKKYLLFFVGILLLAAGCSTVQVSSKGALVSVYRPNTVKEAIVCSAGGDQGIAYMYVGKDTISGNVSSRDKALIAQYARAVLGETRFINPVTVPSMEGEYPDLSIKVLRFSVKTIREGVNIKRYGVFQANFSIRQAGMIECSTAEPILVEKVYVQPAYKKDKLPSYLRVKIRLIKEAVRRVVMQFVPVKSTVLRPVKGMTGVAKSAADMINAGNCVGAYEILRPVADSPGCKDAKILYNAGVALECMAWNNANDTSTQQKYLNKALKYYRKAAMLDPKDADIQRAMSEVSYELNTVFASTKRQKRTKKLMEEYKAPTGF